MHLILLHPGIACIAAYWLFSALVGGMPATTSKSSDGYVWLYNSLHILAGNVTAAIQTKYPQLPSGAVVDQSVNTHIETPRP